MIPNRTKVELAKGTYDFSSGGDTFKVALFEESTEYSPDPDNHEFVDDVFDGGTTGQEFSGSGYSRQSTSGQSVSQNNSNDEARFTFDDVTFPTLGGSATVEAAMLYRQVGGDDTTPGDDDIIRIIDDSETNQLPRDTTGADFPLIIPPAFIALED